MKKFKIFILFIFKLSKFLVTNLFTRLSEYVIFSAIAITIISKFSEPLALNEAFLLYGYMVIALFYDITESLKILLKKDENNKSLLSNEINKIIESLYIWNKMQ